MRVEFQTNDEFPRKTVSPHLTTAKEGHPIKGNLKLILQNKIFPTKLNVSNLYSQNLKILVTVNNRIILPKEICPQNEAKVSVRGCTEKGSCITNSIEYQKILRLIQPTQSIRSMSNNLIKIKLGHVLYDQSERVNLSNCLISTEYREG